MVPNFVQLDINMLVFVLVAAYALKGLVFVVDNDVHRIGWRKSNDC